MAKKLDSYTIEIEGVVVDVTIEFKKDGFVPSYDLSILSISSATNLILEKIREKFVNEIRVGKVEFRTYEGTAAVKEKFRTDIKGLILKFFPNISENDLNMLMGYIIMQDLGLGHIEILLKDKHLEEIVVNSAKEPAWVYHRKHGWCKTNVMIESEDRIRHYSTMIGKDVGKQITVLQPLMDAHLLTGDRVNATLSPITTFGNSLTIRKFAEKPWTITDFIKAKTISAEAAAFIWLAMQHELSVLIAGGTGSGKTSMLNCICNFLPPNQRIISIEDTRELQLPESLHWVPMETRLPNPEGKGEVSMLDLVVNSLRMRPDRIIVGEIRRKKEAEVLFEAMHTGHSVCATIHANNAEEAVIRLTNPPIDIPKLMLPALSLILCQNRNRRTGARRTLQIAEILPSGDPNVLMQLDITKDTLMKLHESSAVVNTLRLYTGLTPDAMAKNIAEKVSILQRIVAKNINDVHQIGQIMAKYYITGEIFR